MTGPRPSNVINVSQVKSDELVHQGFCLSRKRLGAATQARKLGCSLVELPAGKKSWPAHYHLANEEAVYVLEGEGVLVLGDLEEPLRPGDYVTLHAGPPGHTIHNRSGALLRYLAISTLIDPEVCVYPDSEKIGAFAGMAPASSGSNWSMRALFKQGSQVDYWEGEE